SGMVIGWFAWQKLCGNYRVSFYGKLVDDKGAGIGGATVTFQLLYSNFPAIPVPFGKSEKISHIETVTNAIGEFSLNTYGYGLSITGTRLGKQRLEFCQLRQPGTTFTYGRALSPYMIPDTPEKAIVYCM